MKKEKSTNNLIQDSIFTFLKGISMGLADVVPGVSGGTIALITGIYERMINALNSIDTAIPLYVISGDFSSTKRSLSNIHYKFLIPLVSGISLAIIGGSQIIRYSIKNYPAFTYSFFGGMILASAFWLYKNIEGRKLKSSLLLVLGIAGAVALSGAGTSVSNHGLPMIFASGAIAICAMILPGISGAFILLLLGQYEFVLNSIHNFPSAWNTLTLFSLGAVIGLLAFSKLLSFFLDNYHAETLGLLTGLMLGALRKPFEIITGVTSQLDLEFVWTVNNILVTVVAGLVGFLLVIITHRNQHN